MRHFPASRLLLPLVLLGLAGAPFDARALVSFEAPRLVSTYGFSGDAAGDGAGTWIVAFEDNQVFGCCDSDIAYTRSTDGGVTWDPIQEVNDELAMGPGSDQGAQVAGDGAGHWVVVWSFWDYDDPPVDYNLFVARSSDNGMSWSAGAPLVTATTDDDYVADLVTDGAGTWIASWLRYETAQVYVSRSTDNGANWSTTLLGTGAAVNAYPRLATNRAGTWVVAWPAPGPGGEIDIAFARSIDGGVSWSPSALLNTNAASDVGNDTDVDIAADTAGNWLAVWASGGDAVLVARSTAGAVWTAPARIDVPTAPGGSVTPYVATNGGGEWAVAWSSLAFQPALGDDLDVLFSRSTDGGVTWSLPATVNPNAGSDGIGVGYNRQDLLRTFDADGSGTWLIGWQLFYAGAAGPSSFYYSASVPSCPAVASASCKQTLVHGASRLKIKENVSTDDLLTWRWRGEETDLFDLGAPQTPGGRGYALCLYDETAGTPELVFEKDAPAGGTCGTDACWQATSKGFKYRDAKNDSGAITRLDVRTGADKRASMTLRANDFAVAPPAMPLANDARVRAQLRNLDTGTCWEGLYSAPSDNSSAGYRAASD